MSVDGGERAEPGGAAGGGAEARLDELQRLWTPWRMAYVKDPDKQAAGCPFCDLPGRGPEHDADSLILERGERVFVVLNAFPYNPGHLMIVPYRHVPDLTDLDADELEELARVTQRSVRALREASAPHGFNLGMNLGGIAGAGIAEHVHQHVVPRWGGDTNFMPVVGQTKVLPQLLEETYERLAGVFASLP